MKQIITVKKYDTDVVIGQQIEVANSFYTRLKGLMFRKNLQEGEGLLLYKTKQIHTAWMRIPIDVIILKRIDAEKYEVIAIEKGMKPWKFGKYHPQATDVLECKVGTVERVNLEIGDLLFCKFS